MISHTTGQEDTGPATPHPPSSRQGTVPISQPEAIPSQASDPSVPGSRIRPPGGTQPATRNAQHVSWRSLFAGRFTRPRLIALVLFVVALLPRLPGLDRFLTSDENTNIFIAGSDVIAAVLRGDLGGTYWHFYPGVTMSWLDAVGLAGQYLLDVLRGLPTPPFGQYIYGDILSLLVAARLPYAILTAAAVPAIYLLARQLLPERTALLGALFLAFDPFYLAHSRVAHGDAPVAVFMSLSALAFFIYIERRANDIERRTHGAGPTLLKIRPPTADHRPPKKVVSRKLVTTSLDADKYDHKSSFSAFSLQPSASYLILSAILGGLAALTKAPGPFMALFVIGLSMIYVGLELWPGSSASVNGRTQRAGAPNNEPLSGNPPHSVTGSPATRNPQPATRFPLFASRFSLLALPILLRWLTVIIVWGLVSLAVFVLLWPSMWVDPIGTFRRLWLETFGKVNAGHLVYFFGQPTLDPGFWFYFYVIPFRLTPVVLLGSLISLLLLIIRPNSQFKVHNSVRSLPGGQFTTPFLLWLFTLSLLLFGNLSPKKQDRYLLPLFPFLDLLAAVGWLGLLDLTRHFIQTKLNSISTSHIPHLISHIPPLASRLPDFAILLLLGLHFLPVLTYYPYYLTYFNPLLGGPGRAAETTLMGWGEGMEQAAAYLNTKANADRLYVASTPSQTLLPYFAGTGENFYTNDIAFRADYVVLYLAQRQRLAPSPEIIRYFEARPPEKIITIKGVTYAKIYPGPKLILPDMPAGATPVNIGLADTLRLAGYKISDASTLTLYWHALVPMSIDYTISVRARAADGRLLAQQDNWPVEDLLPTSQWRQGDYVADAHTLEISAPDIGQVNHFEVVVYDLETGETLGPPITLPVDNEQ